ncbi:MAG: DinB family protein [Anaerolineaceae bacterium]|nr:DinB family protein [Anaerolineaceae bacterium]
MPNCHPLVTQLRFTRQSFLDCITSVPDEDAKKRINQMNCLSWTIGHLANQENHYWVRFAQDIALYPDLNTLVGYGKPASTPEKSEMMSAWREITAKADAYLDTLTSEILETKFISTERVFPETIGTMLLRNIYHYWYHIGEAHTVRELLGHTDLPVYVGDMSTAFYRQES